MSQRVDIPGHGIYEIIGESGDQLMLQRVSTEAAEPVHTQVKLLPYADPPIFDTVFPLDYYSLAEGRRRGYHS